MSNYKIKVLELVRQRPGVRSVQISDLIDLDLDIVESILAQAIREDVIQADESPAANGLPAKTYSWAGVVQQGLEKQEPVVAVKSEVLADVHTAPVAATPTLPAASKIHATVGRSKSTIAMDYLVLNGPTDRATLMKVMGLVKKYSIEQYLKPQINSGKVVRIDDVYCIPDRSATPRNVIAVDKEKPAPTASGYDAPSLPAADQVHLPARHASGDIDAIDILRLKLTPEEFRGFLKGNVIKYMLRAEHDGSVRDYKRGCEYATWLAESVTAQRSNSLTTTEGIA